MPDSAKTVARMPRDCSSSPTVGPMISVPAMQFVEAALRQWPVICARPAAPSDLVTWSAIPLSSAPDSAPAECTRIMTCLSDGSPYCCTIALAPPPGSAARILSRSGCVSNFTMTIVPPENSTPFGIPFLEITNAPIRMITQERAMACHFQRTKSKFGFLKICMVLYRAVAVIGGLDAERRDLAPRQLPLVE